MLKHGFTLLRFASPKGVELLAACTCQHWELAYPVLPHETEEHAKALARRAHAVHLATHLPIRSKP